MRAVTVADEAVGKLAVSADFPVPNVRELAAKSGHSVLVRVHYAALNHADTLQKIGRYPAPAWSPSPLMGLEVAGEVVEVAGESGASKYKAGDRVMGLLEGGGYAEYAACAPGSLMKVPEYMSLQQAACIPEVWLTAYQLLFKVAQLRKGENVLLHAGSSAVALAAANIATKGPATAGLVTSLTRSQWKLAQVAKSGAQALDRGGFFAEREMGRNKYDVVLDPVGGQEFMTTIREKMAPEGRVVVYAAMGGAKVDLDLRFLFMKRISVLSSTLRARTLDYKAELVADFERDVLQGVFGRATETGGKGGFSLEELCNLDSVFPLADVEKAHQKIAESANVGKILLKMDGAAE